jgi:hypothetical protein
MSIPESEDAADGDLHQASPDRNAVKPPPRISDKGFREALGYLRTPKNFDAPPARIIPALEELYAESFKFIKARLPLLADVPLPIPHRPRQNIREMQDTMEILAAFLLNPEAARDASAAPPENVPPEAIWRALRLLSRHLLLSSLTAAPPGAGIWKQLHQTYLVARRQGMTQVQPEGEKHPLRDEYYAAILLGCAQPTSFTGREVLFLDAYLERFSEQVEADSENSEEATVTFWIDPESDMPATPYSRKPPPPGISVHSFSCGRLAYLLENQLAEIETGVPPRKIKLPTFAGTPAGLGVLNRLIHRWGNPGKRRFQRRRLNYRGELCLGFDNLCRLYKASPQFVETSAWMITNESPDGYAVMHLSGKTRSIAAGDVTALRTESGENWQFCIIRWVLSENQEHVELGLQILSSRAYTANIALPAEAGTTAQCRPALVLPSTPVLRPNEALVVHAGALKGHSKNFVLVIERNNVEIREVNAVRRDEWNGLIELYGIVTE